MVVNKRLVPAHRTSRRSVSLSVLLFAIVFAGVPLLSRDLTKSPYLVALYILLAAGVMFAMILRGIAAQRKREAEFLIAEREKLTSTLECMRDGYYELDADGKLATCNQSLTKLLGVENTRLTGASFASFLPAHDVARLQQLFQWVHRTGSAVNSVEHRFVRPDGTHVSVESSIMTLLDAHGNRIGYRGIVRDITESRSSELQLEESKLCQKLLLAHSPDFVCALSEEGCTLTINPAAEHLTGYRDEEWVGRSFSRFVHLHEENKVRDCLRRTFQGTACSSNLTLVRRDGSNLELQADYVPLMTHGRVSTVYIFGRVLSVAAKNQAPYVLERSGPRPQTMR